MLISHKELQEINNVQTEILKAVSDVCQRLDIRFFMVHGSLLGTIRDHKFVPDDDDIDIAFFRKDYDLFMQKAPSMLEKRFFVQNCNTDPGYTLCFGKVRDSQTTYVIEKAKHITMNHGIYIDIFPIDYCNESGIRAKLDQFKLKLFETRIASVYDLKESTPKKVIRRCSKLILPSLSSTIRWRERLLSSCPERSFVRVSGGKRTEQCIPKSWFEKALCERFENVDVFIPGEYDKYLTRIYGDYSTRTLVEDKVSDLENIEINACIVDTQKPYTHYV